MKAIILAAGYATRLYPLTVDKPKALLPIAKKPIIDYIVDELNTLECVSEIIVVSNNKFFSDFLAWADQENPKKITVLNDKTESEETRLGAIGDIQFVITEKNINEDIIIIAGDNFFTYTLNDYYDFYKEKNADCVCTKEISDIEALKSFAVALTDENDKLINLEEKPENPKSNLAAFATYIYKKETLPLFKTYLEEGNKSDAPGYFLEWLYKRKDVYAWKMNGDCYDIGTPLAYKEICEKYEKYNS
ncbi:MAG: nucleotidyltransferase family protein [Defluviitaleaceae bacterium]|nr:nucleotidyltransferase family protein [Defluviitaleaceae bacterium]